MTRLKTTLICCLLALPAAACGLKGPLYLPEDGAAPPPAVEAEQAGQDEDDGEDEREDGHGSDS